MPVRGGCLWIVLGRQVIRRPLDCVWFSMYAADRSTITITTYYYLRTYLLPTYLTLHTLPTYLPTYVRTVVVNL
jgi:hypothetical protein